MFYLYMYTYYTCRSLTNTFDKHLYDQNVDAITMRHDGSWRQEFTHCYKDARKDVCKGVRKDIGKGVRKDVRK